MGCFVLRHQGKVTWREYGRAGAGAPNSVTPRSSWPEDRRFVSSGHTQPGGPAAQNTFSGEVITEFAENARTYRLTCLKTHDAVRQLKADWQALERASKEPFTYFQGYDWCSEWCARNISDRDGSCEHELYLYTLRCDSTLVMIWPMMAIKSRMGVRLLTFLTEPLGQYANVLVDRSEVSEKAGKQVWKQIKKHARVDAVVINQFPGNSFLEAVLGRFGFSENSKREISLLDLTGFKTWEDHHASLSRSARKQRNKRRNKLAKEGEVAYEVVPGGSTRYRELVDLGLKMKQTWLHRTGRQSSILSDGKTRAFMSHLSGQERNSEGCPAGAFAHALTLNGRPIAIEVGMAMDGHYYSYLGAFDWSWRDYSPGKIQIEAAQKWAKEAGLDRFDFLGDPSDYKSGWSGTTHALHSRFVPNTILGFVYCLAWKSYLRPALKQHYHQMGASARKKLFRLMGLGDRPDPQPASMPDTGKDRARGGTAKLCWLAAGTDFLIIAADVSILQNM